MKRGQLIFVWILFAAVGTPILCKKSVENQQLYQISRWRAKYFKGKEGAEFQNFKVLKQRVYDNGTVVGVDLLGGGGKLNDTPISVLPQIVNGAVMQKPIPYFASLLCKLRPNTMNFVDTWMCGAALVSYKFIITAAHCISENPTCTIKLGSTRYFSKYPKEVVRTTKRFWTHPNYNEKKLIYDFALVEMNAPVTFTKFINPVALPALADKKEFYVGMKAVIYGYGLSDIMRYLKGTWLEVTDEEECTSIYKVLTIDESVFCANGKEGNSTICLGDSGGPLVIKGSDNVPTLIGVASFVGTRLCDFGPPNGFSRVAAVVPWILQLTNASTRLNETGMTAARKPNVIKHG